MDIWCQDFGFLIIKKHLFGIGFYLILTTDGTLTLAFPTATPFYTDVNLPTAGLKAEKQQKSISRAFFSVD